MKKRYPVHLCLKKETDFEDFHPLFNKKNNELLLPIEDIDLLLGQCHEATDNVGIFYGGEVSGKWDLLNIHGTGNGLYDLEYRIGVQGGSFFSRGVSKSRAIEAVLNLPTSESEIKNMKLEFISW